jgi:hypothetical protein
VFLSKRAYQDLLDRITKAEAQSAAQLKANEMLGASMNWFRHRITQVEAERAVLIHHTLGVKIPSPVFERETPTRLDVPINEMAMEMFKPLTDEEAQKQGLTWDAEGRLITN